MKYSIRSILIIALVGLQLAAVAAILISSYLTSERVLLGHARELMSDVAEETIEHAVNFLGPAQDAADLSQRLAQQEVVNSADPDSMERYFFEQLRSFPQFAGVFYGSDEGDFVYVKRDQEVAGAAFRTKIITHDEGLRRVELIWRDGSFDEVARKLDPADSFDPRERPWYHRAAERRGVAWTDPYIFFTSQHPGITVGAPVLAGSEQLKGVVAVDIEIGEISSFIGKLEIGKSGAALLLNRNGDIIAHPDPAKIKTLREDGQEGLRFTRIDELDDPISRAAFKSLGVSIEDLRIPEERFTAFDLNGERYHAAFTPLPQGQWPWTVGIYVPEDDFLGAIKENRRDNILLALLIAAFTAMVGLIMARSITRPIAALSRQADRIARGELAQLEPFASAYRELSRTGTAFSRMASWLTGYKKDNEQLTSELLRTSRELEVRVEERTAALSEANQQLRAEIEERKSAEIQLAEEARQHLKTAEALREARDRADAANAAKSRFLSNMSHELRTPLNVIIGYAQVLKRQEAGEATGDYVGHILEGGDRLLGLIDQVLDLAKIEAGKMLLSIETVDTAALLSTALEEAAVLARQNHVSVVDGTADEEIVPVRADRDRLEQSVMNLMSNAIKYNRPGGRVTLRATREGDSLRIAVEDNGRGISADKQGQLFEPFNRLGAERSTIEGTGVGLALTKEVVEQMGGTLGFRSQAGEGSAFWIDLPVAENGKGLGLVDDHQGREEAPLHFEHPKRVLYVEDHDLSCQLITDAFDQPGDLAIETARSPEEGLAKAKAAKPDLILLDLNLPGMDGFALLERLRGEAHCDDVPVIAITADAMPDQVERCRHLGLAGYLTKPIDLGELRAAIARTLKAA